REFLREIFRAVHSMKGATGFLGFQRLERVAHAGEDLLTQLCDSDLDVSTARMDGLLLLLDTLRGILRGIEQTGAEPIGVDTGLLAQLEMLQQPDTAQKQSETLNATAESAVAAGLARTSKYPDVAPENAAPQVIENPTNETVSERISVEKNASDVSVMDTSVRIDVDVLQRLMNLAGELVLTRNQIVATATDGRMNALVQRLDRVTGEIRDAILRIRMQPVGQIFARFPGLVRELARQSGKRVRLEMEGQQTQMDRSVLGLMRDPLLHALRNAIDHGIETPEVRAARGKPVEGQLRLRAASVGDHVILEIIDDGGGILPDRLRRRAVERGRMSEGQAAALSDREACNLVFTAGFSTAAKVTNVSGRGVGLDVVSHNVERAGGSVEIYSVPGEGTTLRMRLPAG
ncbi:MAG TPA: ATP-binding protein, partial [Acidobacteriaceae bacterium]|nr:ATP-binding protein [Acidobacteriaceae bacterium]